MSLNETEMARMIDHTALKPETTKDEIVQLCTEAKEYRFFSVCVNPSWVYTAFQELKNSDVAICTVIGFPLGANTPEVKAFETKNAIENGATEVDMVINIGALKSGNYELVERDVRVVVEAAKGKARTKAIIETSLLTDEEKIKACQIAVKAGIQFVKTSTGFSTGGATAEDVKLMRETVGPNVGVKASGGVRDRRTADEMIRSGATRIGASAGISIVRDEPSNSDY